MKGSTCSRQYFTQVADSTRNLLSAGSSSRRSRTTPAACRARATGTATQPQKATMTATTPTRRTSRSSTARTTESCRTSTGESWTLHSEACCVPRVVQSHHSCVFGMGGRIVLGATSTGSARRQSTTIWSRRAQRSRRGALRRCSWSRCRARAASTPRASRALLKPTRLHVRKSQRAVYLL